MGANLSKFPALPDSKSFHSSALWVTKCTPEVTGGFVSRGFDWFELDDSRSSGFDSGREIGSGSSSTWKEWLIHQNIRREEERSDNLDRQGRDRSGQERPLRPREERLETILAERVRTRYFDREKEYSLRNSEIHLLSEVGKFRVVGVND